MVTMTFEQGGYAEYSGLHDDDKPITNVANGSLFVEMDTSDVYAFDADGQAWVKLG